MVPQLNIGARAHTQEQGQKPQAAFSVVMAAHKLHGKQAHTITWSAPSTNGSSCRDRNSVLLQRASSLGFATFGNCQRASAGRRSPGSPRGSASTSCSWRKWWPHSKSPGKTWLHSNSSLASIPSGLMQTLVPATPVVNAVFRQRPGSSSADQGFLDGCTNTRQLRATNPAR